MHNLRQSATMSAYEYGIGAWVCGDVHLCEVADDGLYAWRAELLRVLPHKLLTLRAYLECRYVQMWELQLRLDTDAAGAEADVPQRVAVVEVEHGQREQAYGHLSDHLCPAVEQVEVGLGYAERAWTVKGASEYHAAEGVCRQTYCRQLRDMVKGDDLFGGFVAYVVADDGAVVVVAVAQHPRDDGMRGVATVGKDADELLAADECLVKQVPGATGEGDGVHVLIGQHDAMGKRLQRVESGMDNNPARGQKALHGLCEAIEQRVARGEDDDLVMLGITLKHIGQRDGDVYPYGTCRKT